MSQSIRELQVVIVEKDRRIAEKDRRIAERDRRIAELEGVVGELQGAVTKLEENVAQLKRNSSNSSRPPSSDGPGASPRGSNRTEPKKKRRKKGGQPGHKHAKRELLPADKVEIYRPSSCGACSAPLSARASTRTKTIQQIDAPPVKAVVTNYLQQTVSCQRCGFATRGKLPAVAKVGFLGPHFASLVAMLTGKYRLSKREVVRILRDMTGVHISLGSVCNTEQRAARALHEPVLEGLAAIRQSAVVHMDETGWRQGNARSWLWLATTATLAIFGINKSRGTDSATALIGADFGGTLITDRWTAYGFVPLDRRQLCWAHLKRDFQSWVDLGGNGAKYGTLLLSELKLLFRFRRKFQSGEKSRDAWLRRAAKSRAACQSLLRKAVYRGRPKIRGMAKHILKHEPALWTFVSTDGVAPTNNHAERVLRPAVLWRKGCFGTDSPRGSQYVARILSVAASLRLQGRDFLAYVRESLLAFAGGTSGPSLIAEA
jgi:transposase